MNVSVLNLEYFFVVDPKAVNPNVSTYFESNNGLWRDYISELGASYRMVDNLIPLHDIVNSINLHQIQMKSTSNYITIMEPKIKNQLITVSIHGNQDFIRNSKSEVLLRYSQVNTKTIQISQREFLAINEKFTSQLFKLCSQYHTEIVINNSKMTQEDGIGALSGYYIHVLGSQDNITITESSLRILIDNILNNYFLDSIDIQLSMIPLIGGIQLFNFNQVAKQSNSNIYIPDLLPSLFNSKIFSNTSNVKLWITAKTIPEILLTKNIIDKISEERFRNDIIVKEIELTKVKIDLMTLYNQSEILNIMFKHGIFIQMPSLGEKNNCKILIQGCSLEAVNEAVLEVNLLSTSYYCVQLNCVANQLNEYNLIQLMQDRKTCVITSNRFGIDINGNSGEIKQLLNDMAATPCIDFNTLKLRLELHNNQRDFISGKKNGKLIKIMNQLNQLPMIKFSPFNEYNFYIDFEIYEGTNMSVLLKGLDLIEMELPSELKFNIPEVFHKSIIGNGGSIIQSIMKKYNVFIKFSSTVSGTTSKNIYSFKRYDNVLIKCPRKNSKNIQLVKNEIDQLVYQCCLNNNPPKSFPNATTTVYHTVKFQLLKSHYLLLINNNKLQIINELENENNTYINFPTSIEEFKGNDVIVEIKGSEARTKHCFKQIEAMLPKNYEFKVTMSVGKFEETFSGVNKQDFYNNVIVPFKILLGVEISVNSTPIARSSSNENTASSTEDYHQIILSYYNEESLKPAIDSLTLYLRQHGFLILDKKALEFNPLVETVKPNVMALRLLSNQAVDNQGNKPAYKKHKSPVKQPKVHYNNFSGFGTQLFQPIPIVAAKMVAPDTKMIYVDSPQFDVHRSPVRNGHYNGHNNVVQYFA